MTKRIVILIVALASLMLTEVEAQSPIGAMDDISIENNFDTVLAVRKYGSWWFGAFGGANFNINFGDLKVPMFPFDEPDSLSNILMDFGPGNGLSFFGGGILEWVPPGQTYAFSGKFYFFDLQKTNSGIYDLEMGTFREQYKVMQNMTYIGIAPSFRYNLPVTNLYLLGGIDAEYMLSGKATLQQIREGGAEDRVVPVELQKFRFGAHLGVGFDVDFANLYKLYMRVRFSPFLTVSVGNTVFSGYGSSMNTVVARLGLSLKIGPDDVVKTINKFDPNNANPPGVVVQTNFEKGASFPGFNSPPIIIAQIAPFDTSQVAYNTSPPEDSTKIEVTGTVLPKSNEEDLKIVVGKKKQFLYAKPEQSDLSSRMKKYLDNVAEMLIKNPKMKVYVDGYSDDQGTFLENEQRSKERMEKVVKYLISKKVPRLQIFGYFHGSRDWLVPNTTPENRKKNRRVELRVTQ